MKNYFAFTLTGKKLFPVWILFLVLFIIPYIWIIFQFKSHPALESPPAYMIAILFIIVFIAFSIQYFIMILTIENTSYKGTSVNFSGTFLTYIGKILLGILLSIVTLGIYFAWFMRNLMRFFVNNSSYQSKYFEFKVKGGKLFVILLLTILPVIIVTMLLSYLLLGSIYDQKNISWETKFWPSAGKILLEMFLSFITLGIYMPLASVKLYKYFVDRTTITGDASKKTMGYDIEPTQDFLYLWGQILLSIVTAGVYFAWAYSNIGKRILCKTFISE